MVVVPADSYCYWLFDPPPDWVRGKVDCGFLPVLEIIELGWVGDDCEHVVKRFGDEFA